MDWKEIFFSMSLATEKVFNFQTGFNINYLFLNYPTSVVLGVRKTYTIQAHLHRNISCTKIQRYLQGLATQKFTIINPRYRYIIFFNLYLRPVLNISVAPLSRITLSAA